MPINAVSKNILPITPNCSATINKQTLNIEGVKNISLQPTLQLAAFSTERPSQKLLMKMSFIKQRSIEDKQINLTRLMTESKADEYDSLQSYTDKGSDKINGCLRSAMYRPKSKKFDNQVGDFLSDLRKQCDASDFFAFRAMTVTASGVNSLTTQGNILIDFGVQSASVAIDDTDDWLDYCHESDSAAMKKVIIIFDDTIPKYNLSNDMLPNHLVIPSASLLKVVESETINDVTYVHLTQAQTAINDYLSLIAHSVDVAPIPPPRPLASLAKAPEFGSGDYLSLIEGNDEVQANSN